MAERNRLWRDGRTAEQVEGRRASQREQFARLSAERRGRRRDLDKARRMRDPSMRMVAAARRRRRDGIPVTITTADIWIPDDCPVCEVTLTVGSGASSDKSPSIDRYEPALGYVPGNIMIICRGCNRRKQNHTGWQLVQLGLAVIAAKAAYDEQSPYHGLLSGDPLLFGGESEEVVEEYRRLVGAAETAVRLRPPPFPAVRQHLGRVISPS